MKATELRIGNWVYSCEEEKEVELNYVTPISQGYGKSSFHSLSGFKPIPLTEEWLLKFGFERHSSNPFWFRKLQVCVSLVGAIELISWDMQVFKVDNEIKFVHQLQNLYHALTGEELKLIK